MSREGVGNSQLYDVRVYADNAGIQGAIVVGIRRDHASTVAPINAMELPSALLVQT